MKKRISVAAALVAGLLSASSALAVTEDPNEYRMGEWDGDFQFDDPEAWKEGPVTLPPYPERGDLLEVPIDLDRYDFYVDTKNLTLGEDGVTRFTLVIRSRSGAENVFFEGIHCFSKESRAYGYGTSDRAIHPMTESAWRPVNQADPFGIRYELAQFYFCGGTSVPFPPERIIERIKYADHDANTPSDSFFTD